MSIRSIIFTILLTFIFVGGSKSQSSYADDIIPGNINGQVTFLYYKDLAAASNFYGNILKLEKTFDKGWVKFFQTSANAYVGLVDEKNGFNKVSSDKPVMVSIITTEIGKWYDYIKTTDVKVVSPYNPDGANEFVSGFIMEDPGGYTVELFQWNKNNIPTLTKDIRSYQLGGIGAFSEMVGRGNKKLALGTPIPSDEMDVMFPEIEKIAAKNGAEAYRENDFLVTDLFDESLTKGLEVAVIYKGETLNHYLALKREKSDLIKAGKYTGDNRKNIARKMGKLLSYPDTTINELLK